MAADDRQAASTGAAPAWDAGPDGPGAGRETVIRLVLPFGVPALAASVFSLAICYGAMLAESILRTAVPINPHVQAGLMSGFAVLAVVALWRDRRAHGASLPLVLGAGGTALLVATLYVAYDPRHEAIAYVFLVVAALLNQNTFLATLNREVREKAREIASMNRRLERLVEAQDVEIGRLGRLRQFLAPQVAELVTQDEMAHRLDTHRSYIACLFCDMRQFTAATDTAEPEEIIEVLQSFHERVGRIVLDHRGTIGFRAGDGLMAFFNDPVPCDDAVMDCLRLAIDIRTAFEELRASWPELGEAIGLGIGVASGYATLGMIGFQGRVDYTAIGGSVNLSARLCDRASDGQILLSSRALRDVEGRVETASLGAELFKGMSRETEVHELLGLTSPGTSVARP